MGDQKRLQSIWAMTDKSSIDAMRKKTGSTLQMKTSESTSSDESSDSEAPNSTYGSFMAVPKEFRPCLPPSKTEGTKCFTHSSPSATVPESSIQNSNSQSKNCSSNVQKVSPSENESSYPVRCDSPPSTNTLRQNKQTDLTKCENSFENRALAYQISSQDLEKTTNITCSNIDSRKMSSNKNKPGIGSALPDKQNCVTKSKRNKSRTKSSELKYECVEKQVYGTLHLNFEVPSSKDQKSHSKDKIQYKTKVSQNEKRNNKAAHCQTDRGGFCSRSKHPRNEKTLQAPLEENVRWDDALNFRERTDSTKSDSDNNAEDKIAWTVVKERNIIESSTRKYKPEKNATNDFTVEYQSRPADSNYVKKCSKRSHSRRSSNNTRCSETNLNQNQLKTASKYTQSNKKALSFETQNLDLDNNNVKCTKNKMLITEPKNVSASVNNDIFNRQCRIRDQAFTSQNIHRNRNIFSTTPNTIVNSSDKRDDAVIPNVLTVAQGAKESSLADLKAMEEKRNTILEHGREMLDLIIGSHTALSLFFATYESWKTSRQQLINHFEALEKNLKETSKKCAKYKDIINMARTCASAAEFIPLPHVSLAAKVVTIVTGLFSKILKTDSVKADVEDANNITTAVFRDAHASSDLYIYGLQCHQQFEETTKYIEEFHTKARDLRYFDAENGEMTDFIEGMLEYKPNHRTFYAKLHISFQQLRQASFHDFSRRFCEPLAINPSAVEVVRFLSWRFRFEEFSPESVRFEMEQLHNVIQDSNVSVKDLLVRVQSLLKLLHGELGFLETCVRDITLFNGPLCLPNVKENWF